MKGVKVSVKIMVLKTTLETVFGGRRADVFGVRVPDGRFGGISQSRFLS